VLAAIFALLSARVQKTLRGWLGRNPNAIWIVPLVLTGVFVVASMLAGSVRGELIAIVLAYTLAPTLCARVAGAGPAARPVFLDFAAILLLWFPLEFPAGAARLIAKHAQGFLHSAAYGIAILLGLVLFLGFRQFDGMKCNPPRAMRDLRNSLLGFALLAPVLAVVGIWIGFIPPPHLPAANATAGRMALAAVIIFCGTALPEEILFRSMIQNLLMQRFGSGNGTLIVSSLIFGAAHLDNGPQPLPNWRYMILASFAGYAYGKVFQKSTSVTASTTLHAMVDWTKHFFF
jgi:membrane protease YdiL (CAAX protease family)